MRKNIVFPVRGGVRVWKPTVTPVGDLPSVTTPPAAGLYTKTSLAAKKQESAPIGTKHNTTPRPFAPLGGGKALVNNQYNTPAPLYSMNNIADTLSAHTEVLSSGAKGINFMKEAQPVNTDSAVYRMIMEEKETGSHTETGLNHVDAPYRKDSPMTQQKVTQHVSAPITKPPSQTGDKPLAPNCCPECGKTIVGVFVRIKDKSLHPECFKCSTCGSSLKNVGYFNVNDKLYCDAHAKLAAKIAATMPTYEPLVISHPDTNNKTECNRGDVVFLPRIKLATSDVNLPFVLNRRQFPSIPAYTVTIDKSQGQTFEHVGIYLDKPVFSHGQLYVALSRSRIPNHVKIYTRHLKYKENY
ncbi:PDZ and LIM domain protein Zasp [Araneus ventricosus]|uniref:PDZ and LIM domain protein Zasp n=1 Tax=Araneus ventricosus TaxID=182803 RepID=A0A4Y2TUI1_ARAVE|nr:PDZ and LIM domain protein Zasp [Araneus ventricosus]